MISLAILTGVKFLVMQKVNCIAFLAPNLEFFNISLWRSLVPGVLVPIKHLCKKILKDNLPWYLHGFPALTHALAVRQKIYHAVLPVCGGLCLRILRYLNFPFIKGDQASEVKFL